MSKSPYRALRAALLIFFMISIMGGLLMILVGKPFMTRLMLNPPAEELSTLCVFLMREVGGILLWMGFILYVVYRDPVRHARVIDASILGLCVLAVTSPLSFYTTDLVAGFIPLTSYGVAASCAWPLQRCSTTCARKRNRAHSRVRHPAP